MNKFMPWPTKRLSEVCEQIKIEKAPMGTLPYIEIGDIDIDNKTTNFKEKGAVKGSIFTPTDCVIVSRVRPTRGAVILLNKKLAISSAFTILKPKSVLNLRFLFYYLAYNPKFFGYLGKKQKGSNYPSCREKDILNFKIPLPSIAEQKKIVEKIEKLFAKINEASRLRAESSAASAALLPSALHQIFNSKIKIQKSKSQFKIQNWPTKKLGEIAQVEWGNTSITKRQYIPSGFLAISAAGPDGFLPFADYECPAIILSAIGARCGKCFLVDGKWTAIKNTIVIRPNQEQVDIKYLFYFVNNEEKWQRVKAAAQPFISQKNAKELEITLPPITEQKKIVAYLDALSAKTRELQNLQKETATDFSALRQSVLAKAFE